MEALAYPTKQSSADEEQALQLTDRPPPLPVRLPQLRAPFETPEGYVHSFCVPEACDRAIGYFGQFTDLGTHDGHRYYGGDRQQQVTLSTRSSSAAPMTSLRPRLRPTGPAWDALVREQRQAAAVSAAVALANQ